LTLLQWRLGGQEALLLSSFPEISPTPSPTTGAVNGMAVSAGDGLPLDRHTPPTMAAAGSVGHMTGAYGPDERRMEQVIAYGGILDPASNATCISHRIQAQPDVDDLQLGCAMRATKLRDVEATTGMLVNSSCSILHFSENEIFDNVGNLGISLGSNGKEIAKSVSDILDLEAERTLEMILNVAAVKPMNDAEINNLGITAVESFCDDLIPSSEPEDVVDGTCSEVYGAPLPSDRTTQTASGCMDVEEMPDKPKRTWKRKVYPASAVRRSARVKFKKKNP
jgi:hypothetical protein